MTVLIVVLPGVLPAREPEPAMPTALNGMTALTDSEMGDVDGHGLFWSDRVGGGELAGTNAFSTPFTFYRMGLDVDLSMNTNIAKLQLGCGGANDFMVAKAGCDVDMDYVSLMGRSGTSPGNAMSAFTLRRPYLEIAVLNDGTANREIAGIKIGAQSAEGAISVGRRYETNGAVNQENNNPLDDITYPTNPDVCYTGDSVGTGVLGCHSGINTVSGFLGAEMSITMRVIARICGSFIIVPGVCATGWLPLDAWGCAGRTASTVDLCGTARADALFIDAGGTRMTTLGMRSARLKIDGNGASALLTTLLNNAYASLDTDLRSVHKLTMENTNDFFLSFQRQPIAYPRFSKMSPINEMTANGTLGTAMDACATSNYAMLRCQSAYAVPANTGWWLNSPSVKLLDIFNPNANVGDLFIDDVTAMLAPPGLLMSQAELQMRPAKNCYGASRFC